MIDINNKAELLKRRLIYEISSGCYHPGDRLPSERELAARYHLSRNTVRLAIGMLIQDHAVENRPYSGNYITSESLRILQESGRVRGHDFKVIFAFPVSQVANPLWLSFLQTVCANLGLKIKVAVELVNFSDDVDEKNLCGDVLILFGCTDIEQIRRLEQLCGMVIVFNQKLDDFNYITPDNFRGGEMMTEYLLAGGHRKIGVVSFDSFSNGNDFPQRSLGILQTLKAYGIQPREFLINPAHYGELDDYCSSALEYMLSGDDGVTGILCVCDMLAIGIKCGCDKLHLKIPEDVSLIGFDDQPCVKYLQPAFTTIKYPAEAMAIHVAEYVNQRRNGIAPPTFQKVVEPLLLERESVKRMT